MKITFIIATLGSGGAERVCVSFANELCKEHSISIVKFHKDESFYKLDERVEVKTLEQFNFDNLYNKIASRIKKFFALRKLLKEEKSDVFVSFLDSTNIACIMANAFLKTPLIICEHSSYAYLKSKFWKSLRRLTYPYANLLTVLSNNDKKYYENFVKDVRVLLNPCHFSTQEKKDFKKENLVIFIARLDENKNASMYLRAIARLDENLRKTYKFFVIGSGDLRQRLEKEACALKITVDFLGKIEDVKSIYERAKVLCLCSFVEGLPTVLIESLYFDVARISTVYDGNVEDLIEDKKDGLLVDKDDDLALSKALSALLVDDELRLSLIQNARAKQALFDSKNVAAKLLSFIQEVRK